jgi:hypothetical protein
VPPFQANDPTEGCAGVPSNRHRKSYDRRQPVVSAVGR